MTQFIKLTEGAALPTRDTKNSAGMIFTPWKLSATSTPKLGLDRHVERGKWLL